MNKKSALFILFMLTGFMAKAQDSGDFDLGFKAHPVFGWMSPDAMGKSNGTFTGFSFGLIGDYYLRERYALGFEFALTNINGGIRNGNAKNNPQTNYKLQYLEIPLTMKLKTNEIGNGKIYGKFGFDIGILLRAKASGIEFVEGTEVRHDFENRNVSEDMQPLRLGMVVGGGYELRLSESIRAALGLSYNDGFTNVFKGKENKTTNSYFSVDLGLFF